jgi:transposase
VSPRTARGVVAQKKSLIATERDEQARAAWRAVMAAVPAEELVFVDESGFHTRMTPLYACAPRGQRADGHAPRNHTRNTTLVAALSLTGVGDTMTIEGAMDAPAFVAWLEQGLAPTLRAGQRVVMDNLSVHKDPRVRTIIEGRACQLIYLPAYSPDLTPIEGMFSKVKTVVRRAGKREQESLVDAIGAALDRVTPADAEGWFSHCGYATQQVQSLCEPL